MQRVSQRVDELRMHCCNAAVAVRDVNPRFIHGNDGKHGKREGTQNAVREYLRRYAENIEMTDITSCERCYPG